MPPCTPHFVQFALHGGARLGNDGAPRFLDRGQLVAQVSLDQLRDDWLQDQRQSGQNTQRGDQTDKCANDIGIAFFLPKIRKR